MFLLDGKPLALDTAFSHNEIQYPANWLRLASPEERAAIGVTEVADPESYDQRFYWGPNNPKDLEELKAQWISHAKATAGQLLARYDWMVVRAAEGVKPVDLTITAYRQAVRDYSDALENDITACENVEALIAVLNAQAWPSED